MGNFRKIQLITDLFNKTRSIPPRNIKGKDKRRNVLNKNQLTFVEQRLLSRKTQD